MLKHFLFAIIAMTITGAFLSKTHAEQTDAPTDVFLNEGDDDFSWPIEKPIEAKAEGKKESAGESSDAQAQAAEQTTTDVIADAPPKSVKKEAASAKTPKAVAKSPAPSSKPAAKTQKPSRQVATATAKKTKAVDSKKKKTGKKPASVDQQSSEKSDKSNTGKVAVQGEYKFLKNNCVMRRGPASTSASLTTIKGNKKIWVEDQGNGWVKGFREKGHGFLNKNCFK